MTFTTYWIAMFRESDDEPEYTGPFGSHIVAEVGE
jgi:hypothetical protein